MAEPAVFDANKVLIKISNEDSPETFDHPCLINLNRTLTISKDMVEEVVYDCDDVDAPGTVYRLVRSVSLSASGAGKTDRAGLAAYVAWALSANAKSAQIEMGGAGGQRILCDLHLTEFTPAEGETKNYATGSVSFASTGAITNEVISA